MIDIGLLTHPSCGQHMHQIMDLRPESCVCCRLSGMQPRYACTSRAVMRLSPCKRSACNVLRAQGHAAYRDRLAQMRLLRLGLADARRELHLLRTGVANVDVLRREARCTS